MKKLALILGTVLVVTGCNEDSTEPKAVETQSAETVVKKAESVGSMNAEAVVNKFKESGLSIGEIVVYDEKTDPNKLLNRPNQYTQKVSFADTSIEQPDPDFLLDDEEPFNGGTIEVFPNEELAKARKDYVEAVTKEMPMIQQYIYINGTAVLRLEHDVLPSDAEKYEKIFMNK